jgi:hypothetical protein
MLSSQLEPDGGWAAEAGREREMTRKGNRKSRKTVKNLPVEPLEPARERKVTGGYRGRYQLRLDQGQKLIKP